MFFAKYLGMNYHVIQHCLNRHDKFEVYTGPQDMKLTPTINDINVLKEKYTFYHTHNSSVDKGKQQDSFNCGMITLVSIIKFMIKEDESPCTAVELLPSRLKIL